MIILYKVLNTYVYVEFEVFRAMTMRTVKKTVLARHENLNLTHK